MIYVRFYPGRQSIAVPPGITILEAARQAGILMESPCNGLGTCGKCIVHLDVESLGNICLQGTHTGKRSDNGTIEVLSCQAQVMGNITVEIPACEQPDTLEILSHGELIAIKPDPWIKRIHDETERSTGVFAGDRLLAREPGNTCSAHFGVVVDIGTTTLVASLVDLSTGTEIGTASALNPQSRHAHDVLSRVRFASEQAGLVTMQANLLKEINRLVADLSKQAGIAAQALYEVVYSGNTCMLHLAIGANPASLGKYPYTPLIRGGNHVAATRHGLDIADSGLIYLPPVISGYVGADITSGILATGLHRRKGTTLLIDIGTNGEMIIARDGYLRATSTAAGPAFEGMNISCGMRACNGAIESFAIAADGTTSFDTIGNGTANGICGSGLLDIVSELVEHGVICDNGRFIDTSKAPTLPVSLKERLFRQEGKPAFHIEKNVFLSQKDIRQIQLAKGAIRTGIEFLLRDTGIGAGEVDHVLIAGSFGYHLREKSLLKLGLLPREFAGKIHFVGNTSKSGGQAFLLNQRFRDEMSALVDTVEVIELASFDDFDRMFVKFLNF
jgi:uncharacterized 2Fe-2S/4Fe-4S cluster protein (DUF4445 family)